MSEKELYTDEDYVLNDGPAFIRVKNFSIMISKKPDGVSVQIWNRGEEGCDEIDGIYVFDNVDSEGGA